MRSMKVRLIWQHLKSWIHVLTNEGEWVNDKKYVKGAAPNNEAIR